MSGNENRELICCVENTSGETEPYMSILESVLHKRHNAINYQGGDWGPAPHPGDPNLCNVQYNDVLTPPNPEEYDDEEEEDAKMPAKPVGKTATTRLCSGQKRVVTIPRKFQQEN